MTSSEQDGGEWNPHAGPDSLRATHGSPADVRIVAAITRVGDVRTDDMTTDGGLAALLDALDGDDEAGFALRRAEWIEDDVRLTGQVIANGEGKAVWEITCRDVLGYTAGAPAWGGALIIDDREHPLLRQYIEPIVPLYYGGRAANVAALVGELWFTHRDASGSRSMASPVRP